MKNLIFLAMMWMILFPTLSTAQEADQKIGEIINRSDWFALEKEYPKLKDKMTVPFLKWLSEAMLGLFFNRPQEAIAAIDTLLTHHQEEIGFDNTSNMVIYRYKLLGEMGHYAESADGLKGFLEQISEFVNVEDFPIHNQLAAFYDEIRDEEKPSIVRPGKNTEIPMDIEPAGRGVLMFVPVTVNGKEYKFIFDTGAASTFVSQRMADEMGLRITRDSLLIKGVAEAYGKAGTTDSIMIGDISFKNPMITISLPNPAVDTVYQVDAVLGSDFMRLVGEVNIYPKDEKIVFPFRKTPIPTTGRNMFMNNGGLYMQTYSEGKPLVMFFDTGNVRGDLFPPYYEKNKAYADSNSVKDTINVGGFGGVFRREVLVLNSMPLTVGKTSFNLENTPINFDKAYVAQGQEDGSLGMDFIRLFKKVIISFDNMFTSVQL